MCKKYWLNLMTNQGKNVGVPKSKILNSNLRWQCSASCTTKWFSVQKHSKKTFKQAKDMVCLEQLEVASWEWANNQVEYTKINLLPANCLEFQVSKRWTLDLYRQLQFHMFKVSNWSIQIWFTRRSKKQSMSQTTSATRVDFRLWSTNKNQTNDSN